jgi:hypothetical protein
MAHCKVVLEDSFKRALVQLPARVRDQIAVVIRSLEQECEFNPDPAEYILQVNQYISFCEHVEGWGWSVSWYQEDGVIVVNAERSSRIPLIGKAGKG